MTPRSGTVAARRGTQWSVAIAGAFALSLVVTGCATGSAAPAATPAASEGQGAAAYDEALHKLLPQEIQDRGTISFGALWETPPVIATDPKDPTKPIGISPALAADMGKVLGVEVEWQNLQWPAQLPGLQAGNVDVLFGQVSDTAERELSVVDIIPFQQRAQALLVPEGNPESINAIADLCGLTVGVPVGSNQATRVQDISTKSCIDAGKPAIQTADYQGSSAAVQALRAGTIDAWQDVLPSVEAIVKANTDVFDTVKVPLSEAPVELSGIAIAKENPGLSEAIAGALKALIEDGSYAKVYDELGSKSSQITADMVTINPLTGTPVGEKAAG